MIARMEKTLRGLAHEYGQDHVFRFWDGLDETGRLNLLRSLERVDFALMDTLIQTWVLAEPAQETFRHIVPVEVIPAGAPSDDRAAAEAFQAGEQALRDGRVAAFVVAGGQGTRLGFEGPKGSYPIGAVTGKSLFQYHAEKIRNLQRRYDTVIPWYIMVSPANEADTRSFFEQQAYFGLNARDLLFFTQRMVPCVDESGKFLLEAHDRIALSPNGHGGAIQALIDGGALDDAEQRGVDTISYFQVDNWAVKVVDPLFIGHHVLRNASMSSKCHRRNDPREAVGVHCLCDGVYRVVEYSELDLYPQLLETDEDGAPRYYAGNPAIHALSVDFVRGLYERFDVFPWHKAFKRIPHVDEAGALVTPERPNGYKFETFVFDALRFAPHPPVALEILRPGEYTPIKQFDGVNSVVAARAAMTEYWADWLEAAGHAVPRSAEGTCLHAIEISPEFALTRAEFVERARGCSWKCDADLAINADGSCVCVA